MSFEENVQILKVVLKKLQAAHLTVKSSKHNLFCEEVNFLSHIIYKDSIRADPDKVEVVWSWPSSHSSTKVTNFVGLASYYGKLIPNFAAVAQPLHRLSEKRQWFMQTVFCKEAFLKLKRKLISAPILACLDPQLIFILDTSDNGTREVLAQQHGIK